MKRKWRDSTHKFCQHFKKKQKFERKGLKVVVLAQDETHVQVKFPSIRVVCPKDEKPKIKANWDMNLRTSVHGCIDNEGKWTITQEDIVILLIKKHFVGTWIRLSKIIQSIRCSCF